MAQFESNVKFVPYSQERVYNKLEDLNNLSGIKERLEQVRDKVGDKIQFTSTDIYDEGWFHSCGTCRWYNVDTGERYRYPYDIPEFTAALYRMEVME